MRKPAYLRHLEAWKEHLISEGYADRTCHRTYPSAVKAAYRYLEKNGYETVPRLLEKEEVLFVVNEVFKNNPTSISAWNHFLKFCNNPILELIHVDKVQNTRINADWLDLDKGEDFLVLDACKTSLEKVVIHCELNLGMRRCEVMRQERSWFNGGFVKILGKGKRPGKWRTVPVHSDTFQILKLLDTFREDTVKELRKAGINDELPQNITAYKHPFKREIVVPQDTAIDNIAKRVSKRSGIKFSNHTLRRTCGRTWYKANVSLPLIRDYLGHEDVNQTIEYLGINLTDQEEAQAKVSAFNDKRRQEIFGKIKG